MKDKIEAWFTERGIKNFDVRRAMETDGFEVRMFERLSFGIGVVRTFVVSEEDFDRLEWLVETFNEGQKTKWENAREDYWYPNDCLKNETFF